MKISKLAIGITAMGVFILVGLAIFFISKIPRTLIVPDEYKDIQTAVEKARPGDTVFVKAGT